MRSLVFRLRVAATALVISASVPAFGQATPPSDAPPSNAPPSEAPATPAPSETASTEAKPSTSELAGENPSTETATAEKSLDADAANDTERAEPPDPSKAWETAPHEHRGGFAMGVILGLGVGASNGFPADTRKIGRAEFYTESGLGLATTSTLWIGGALADWLTFGVGGGFGVIVNEETISPAPTAVFHTDVYPLYALGGALRNLGVTLDFGLGFARTEDRETEDLLIDAGGASHVFAGVLFEGIEVWKLKMGPFAGVHYLFSETIRRPAAILGFRTSLYTLP